MSRVNVKLNDGVPLPLDKQSSEGNHPQKSFLSKNIWCQQVLSYPAEEEKPTPRYELDDNHVDCSKSLTIFTE